MILLTSTNKHISNCCTILLTHWVTGKRQLKDPKLIIVTHSVTHVPIVKQTAVNGALTKVPNLKPPALLLLLFFYIVAIYYLYYKKEHIFDYHLIMPHFINRIMKPQLTQT